MSKGKKIVIWSIGVLFTIVVTSIVGEYFYLNNLFNKMVNVEISKTSIGITEEVEETLSKYRTRKVSFRWILPRTNDRWNILFSI
ncbi:hypothetical protein H8S20_04325 [Clostridium sp. NSJ-6]|uniref:Uncharacterized protein n=1 Tax=Clostridium hominis TaxID=2763036 RepID=A0ABR7D9Q2_9CLOT|nr:hypothetical protein [Clostridium hominis]MBC5628116.1 hypothetical protein [Clostridium hominis]MDU2673124.1 hypothetical protein [Clostridium sp.]